MRLNIASTIIVLAVCPSFANGFYVSGKHAATQTRFGHPHVLHATIGDENKHENEVSTKPSKRSPVSAIMPLVCAASLLFGNPDDVNLPGQVAAPLHNEALALDTTTALPSPHSALADQAFQEIDWIDRVIGEPIFTFPRTPLSLLDSAIPQSWDDLDLGFHIVEKDKDYMITFRAPEYDAENIKLQVGNDGRVLRLKGNKNYEDEGTKFTSTFEREVLLPPDIHTTKLKATMNGDEITVMGPKTEKKAGLLSKTKTKDIKIEVEQPKVLEIQKEDNA